MLEMFQILFLGMEWYIGLLLGLGLAFMAMEIFVPGFGFFGISGAVMLLVSVITRAFMVPKDVRVGVAFTMLFFIMLILGFVLIVAFIAVKCGWLNKVSIFKTGTAVDEDRSDATADYSDLVGKVGKSSTELRPVGKVSIEGVTYDMISDTGVFIEKECEVRVVKVEGARIAVEKI